MKNRSIIDRSGRRDRDERHQIFLRRRSTGRNWS